MSLNEILKNQIKIDEVEFKVSMTNQLSRINYLELKKYLELIGGTYNKSGKDFVFTINPISVFLEGKLFA